MAWHKKKNCRLLLGKHWRTHITWKEITVPDSPPLFLSVNISAMVSSPQPQHHIPWSSWTAAWQKKKNCHLLLGKPWRTHITWKEINICLTVPDSPPLFLSVNISATVSSPQNPRITSIRVHELLSLMAHSPCSQAEELMEVSPLLAPPLTLYSWNSPPMCDRDPLSQVSVFHFHLLGIIPPLARLEVILDMYKIISPHLARLPGTQD